MSETINIIGHFVLDQKSYRTFCILVIFFFSLKWKFKYGREAPRKKYKCGKVFQNCSYFLTYLKEEIHILYIADVR